MTDSGSAPRMVSPGHVANAYEDVNGNIELQMAYSTGNVFFWWTDKDGKGPKPGELECALVWWNINYHSNEMDLGEPDIMIAEDMEFPRIDDRLATLMHSKILFNIMDKAARTDMRFIGPVLGGKALPRSSTMCLSRLHVDIPPRRTPHVQWSRPIQHQDEKVREILRWSAQVVPGMRILATKQGRE